MKKSYLILVLIFAVASLMWAQCVTIQDGVLTDVKGNLITLGYDEFGYNYQAHIFNGRYCDYDRVEGGDFCDVELIMKWNDAWLSNKSCDFDTKLDRHFGFESYRGSGAWLTNHQSGWVVDAKGKRRKWTYFVKIVSAPEDAYVDAPYDSAGNGTYYTVDGIQIGPQIWGAHAVIQRVSNDPSLGEHGIQYKSPVGPGFGKW